MSHSSRPPAPSAGGHFSRTTGALDVVDLERLRKSLDDLAAVVVRFNECRAAGLVPRTDLDGDLIHRAGQGHREIFGTLESIEVGEDFGSAHPTAIDPTIYPLLISAFSKAMESTDMPADRDGVSVAWDYVIAQAVLLASQSRAAMPKRSEWRPTWIGTPATPRRVPIPAEERRKILDRDGRRCVQCGSADDLALDHIFPFSKGGPDDPDNFQVLCRSCNSSKGAKLVGPPKDYIADYLADYPGDETKGGTTKATSGRAVHDEMERLVGLGISFVLKDDGGVVARGKGPKPPRFQEWLDANETWIATFVTAEPYVFLASDYQPWEDDPTADGSPDCSIAAIESN
jgi:hypothetical protein